MTESLHVIVLAAGKGTRMNSVHPKVLHRIAGRRLLDYVLDSAQALAPRSMTVVVGHEAERIQHAYETANGLRFVVQEPQLGTGHALLQTEPLLRDETGTALLLYGDVPLLSEATLRRLVAQHRADGAAATVVTANVERPYGYGRIVRTNGRIARIVEERDASPAERAIKEVNAGIYAFDLEPLFDAIRSIAERPRRVLPARPDCDLSPPEAGGLDADGRERPRDPRHQQPQRAGGSGSHRATDEE